jgi:GR25 family glycosyltransferase involved in LPS biosynthesis
MIEIKLSNIIVKEESDYKIIYKPESIPEDNECTICISSKIPNQIQFIAYANFIDWIQFSYVDLLNVDQTINYNNLSDNGNLVSCVVTDKNILTIKFKPIDLCAKITLKNIKINFIKNYSEIYWDNIFIINLARRLDRKELMINKLQDAQIDKYEFIEAIDGLDPEIINQFHEEKTKNPSNPIVTSGHFACLLSHIKAIKLAKIRNYSTVMILEDDVYFCNDFLNKLSNVKVSEYDMIYLGGIVSRKKIFLSHWAYSDEFKIMGAYGYILSKSLYNKVLLKLEKLQNYVDLLYIKEIQPKYKVLLLDDFIKTDLASSDTSHKSKKMTKRLKYIK